MNHTTDKPVYILLKDLPDAKAGTILILDSTDNCYDYIATNGEKCWYKKYYVEENSTWFQLQQPKEERIKVYTVRPSISHNSAFKHPKEFVISLSDIIPKEKYEDVKKAIERTLNNEITLNEVVQDYLKTNYPVEDKEKDWLVLSFISKFKKVATLNISTNKYDYEPHNEDTGWSLSELIENGSEIHSVLRKSDNTTFTLGDEVIYLGQTLPPMPILEIRLYEAKEGNTTLKDEICLVVSDISQVGLLDKNVQKIYPKQKSETQVTSNASIKCQNEKIYEYVIGRGDIFNGDRVTEVYLVKNAVKIITEKIN